MWYPQYTFRTYELYIYIYIGLKTFFYVVRHLDSIASYLPTGLHLGFFRLWPSLYPEQSFLLSSSFYLLFRHPLQCYFGCVINGNVYITKVSNINVELGNTGLIQAVSFFILLSQQAVTLPTLVRGHSVRRHVPSAVCDMKRC